MSTNTIVIIILILIVCLAILILKSFNLVMGELDILKAQSKWAQDKLKDAAEDNQAILEEVKIVHDKITDLEIKIDD